MFIHHQFSIRIKHYSGKLKNWSSLCWIIRTYLKKYKASYHHWKNDFSHLSSKHRFVVLTDAVLTNSHNLLDTYTLCFEQREEKKCTCIPLRLHFLLYTCIPRHFNNTWADWHVHFFGSNVSLGKQHCNPAHLRIYPARACTCTVWSKHLKAYVHPTISKKQIQ